MLVVLIHDDGCSWAKGWLQHSNKGRLSTFIIKAKLIFNGNSYIGKMASLYWNTTQALCGINVQLYTECLKTETSLNGE